MKTHPVYTQAPPDLGHTCSHQRSFQNLLHATKFRITNHHITLLSSPRIKWNTSETQTQPETNLTSSNVLNPLDVYWTHLCPTSQPVWLRGISRISPSGTNKGISNLILSKKQTKKYITFTTNTRHTWLAMTQDTRKEKNSLTTMSFSFNKHLCVDEKYR